MTTARSRRTIRSSGKDGYNPEIFTLGHRVNLGMTLNPWTKEFWVSEHGPQGGDEVNILRAGQNYGWPVVSDGRYYSGTKVSPVPYKDGHDAAAYLLCALDRAGRHGVLHRRQIPRLASATSSSAPCA